VGDPTHPFFPIHSNRNQQSAILNLCFVFLLNFNVSASVTAILPLHSLITPFQLSFSFFLGLMPSTHNIVQQL
jgi:hypothetical protein